MVYIVKAAYSGGMIYLCNHYWLLFEHIHFHGGVKIHSSGDSSLSTGRIEMHGIIQLGVNGMHGQ
jgi:hypothetical protein